MSNSEVTIRRKYIRVVAKLRNFDENILNFIYRDGVAKTWDLFQKLLLGHYEYSFRYKLRKRAHLIYFVRPLMAILMRQESRMLHLKC